jgi:hypothetical protein
VSLRLGSASTLSLRSARRRRQCAGVGEGSRSELIFLILMSMMDDKYRPRTFEELASDPTPVSWLNEAPAPDNVGVLVSGRKRSLHAIVAQNLADTEALIGRLEAGVRVADSGRGLIRDLYVQCRKQREVLAQALRLELE